ncbi:hypothetical protein LBMAG52_28860 [Planctomycetia bacterium]|nr:hypothetical protein LBMAG52_28860 [Planctomycetia bacterium]
MWSRWIVSLAVALLALAWCLAQEPASSLVADKSSVKSNAVAKDKDDTPKELFSGKVVFLQEALKRRGVKATEEFKAQVVLETHEGELIPIVPDWRGRAFYQDERLRDRRVDLVGSRQKAAPYLQVQMVFVFDEKGTRQYMDYWCDICSIAMYELKPCDCCQEEIRLRFQPQGLPEFVKRPAKK